MKLGVHVFVSDGFPQAVEHARSLGCDTMQIFSRSPRGWVARPLETQEIEAFQNARSRAGIGPLAVHASYLINLASPNPMLHRRSITALVEELRRADRLGADYLVVHVGSDSAHHETEALPRMARALRRVLKDWRFHCRLLLENTAGERGDMGNTGEQLGWILKEIGDPEPVGICLDTCHLFAAGYDIRTEDGVNLLAKEMDRTVGLDRVRLIHANDSKKDLNCRVDRHQHIGEGFIGLEGFRAFINHPAFRTLPFVLETPKKDKADDPRNLKTLRGLKT
jgi:deoxyribonuclease-4